MMLLINYNYFYNVYDVRYIDDIAPELLMSSQDIFQLKLPEITKSY